MILQIKNLLNRISVWTQKNLTLGLFFLLPGRVSNIFVSLSIISLIYDVRNIDIKTHPVDSAKFKSLLQISFNEDIMLLPQYTMSWFWAEEFLNGYVEINQMHIKLKDALKDDEILFHHLRDVVEILLQHIPKILKYKLNLDSLKEKLLVKHNVMNLLIHA